MKHLRMEITLLTSLAWQEEQAGRRVLRQRWLWRWVHETDCEENRGWSESTDPLGREPRLFHVSKENRTATGSLVKAWAAAGSQLQSDTAYFVWGIENTRPNCLPGRISASHFCKSHTPLEAAWSRVCASIHEIVSSRFFWEWGKLLDWKMPSYAM